MVLSFWRPADLLAQDTTKIILERADTWEYNAAINPDAQRLLGHVILRHDTGYMFCDSAWLNDKQNDVKAYGNVHIKASDTLNLYGDSLQYNGNSRVARIWGNVKLIDNRTILTTDSLEFNRNTQVASYTNWGKIVNAENNLVSKFGFYITNKKEFFFRHRVILMNPGYVMNSDTLMYNTETEVAYFFGPSTIVSHDKTDSIYCVNGWYDTRNDISEFNHGAKIYHESQLLSGETIYYERNNGFGRVQQNGFLFDSSQNIALAGNYGEIRRKEGKGFMTDKAVGIMIGEKDSLFMHADTIRAVFEEDDTNGEKIKTVIAYYRVKFFREDIQGACDSLIYSGIDSVFFMYNDPVLWSEENQLTADTISLTIRNGEPDSMALRNAAFMVAFDDTGKFNQIKGRDMTGYFLDRNLYKVRVLGNSETIYFIREDDRSLIGINKLYAGDMLIFLQDNDISTITYINEPSGTVYPEDKISPYDMILKNFRWLDDRRPKKKEDIFR
jgi:lipopolysaccharide export system protein LptA